MAQNTLHTISTMKQNGEKISMLTSYDATFTHRINEAGVDMILVGDSLGMVLQGLDSTLPVTIADMVYHTRCVKAGNQNCLLMSDMPFMTYRTPEEAMTNAAALMQAGAQIVKLEGGMWLQATVAKLFEQGIPVCAHLGLTPQAINKLGGYRVQGRTTEAAQTMLDEAIALEAAGASMILLECVPSSVGKAITAAVSVPVIGIGAGPDTDAQVLVLHDILGITAGKQIRFVKNFMAQEADIQSALAAFARAVKDQSFPAPEHCFE
ncbi:MAG TPA: 3-methyl-2-oxobutanoate hydroxymethyltransferase [Oceanospirillaceae bacterium]|nr:3-methyl-2-oxobutanoate hydroxymethyltransferase [Oceanospirillaceae bacterium]